MGLTYSIKVFCFKDGEIVSLNHNMYEYDRV